MNTKNSSRVKICLLKKPILEAARRHGWGLKGLAGELEISKSYLSMLLNGRRNATGALIARLSEKFPELRGKRFYSPKLRVRAHG